MHLQFFCTTANCWGLEKYPKQSQKLRQKHSWYDFQFNFPVKVMQYFNSFFTTQKQRNEFILCKTNILREFDVFLFILDCKLIRVSNCLVGEGKMCFHFFNYWKLRQVLYCCFLSDFRYDYILIYKHF